MSTVVIQVNAVIVTGTADVRENVLIGQEADYIV